MMKWTKPSAAIIEYFERIAPGPPIEARVMFGMPSRFLNGHMLASVFGDSIMLHLSASDREACIADGARPFAPHGRSAKEYVEIGIGHFEDRTLKEWFARGMRYLGSLPPKLGEPATAKRAEPGAKPVKAKPKAKAVKPTAAKANPAKAMPANRKPEKAKPAKAKAKTKPAAKQRAAKAVASKAGPAKKAPAKKTPAPKPAPSRRAAKKARSKKRR